MIMPFYPFYPYAYPYIENAVTHRSYTIRIEELLKIKHPELDPLDADQMLQAGLDSIFKNMNLNVIDEKYRDTFIVQFLNEFYMNEIGQETIDFFRQNLNKIIMQKGRFISNMYNLAEKEYFIEYSYRTQNTKHNTDTLTTGSHDQTQTTTNDGTKEGTRNAEADDTRNMEHSKTLTGEGTENRNQKTDKTESGNVDTKRDANNQSTGNSTQTDDKNSDTSRTMESSGQNDNWNTGKEKTGSTATTGSHSVTTGNTTTETNGQTITDVDHTGTVKTEGQNSVAKNETVATENNLTDTTTYDNNIHHTDTKNGTDTVTRTPEITITDMVSDTPQDGLEAVESGTYLSEARVNKTTGTETTGTQYGSGHEGDDKKTGTDSVAHTGTSTVTTSADPGSNYTEQNQTVTNDLHDKSTATSESHGTSNSNTTNDTNGQTVNEGERTAENHDTGTMSGNETEHHVTKDGGTSKVDKSENGESHETGNQTSTSTGESTVKDDLTRNTKDEENGSQTETGNRTEKVMDSQKDHFDGSIKTNGTDAGTSNVNGTNDVIEEYYKINRDAVFQTNDFTDRIWELFYDCFMQAL